MLASGGDAGEAQHWTREVLVGVEREAAWCSAKVVCESEKKGGACERGWMTLLISGEARVDREGERRQTRGERVAVRRILRRER